MYEYNNGVNYNQAPTMTDQQTVPNVMMDDSQQGGYSVQAPLEMGQTTATLNGGTAQITMVVSEPEGPQFDIPDQVVRRVFVRKLLMIIMLQYICALPVIELFLMTVDEPADVTIYSSYLTLRLILYAIMYAFSEFRRNPPFNIVILVIVTLMQAIGEGIYATMVGNQTALFPPFVIIFQLLILMAYSKQDRFKFSNINGMTLMLLIFIIATLLFKIILPTYVINDSVTSFFSACYFIYDTHLMLTGFHGYNLNSDEHLFAVTNLYADFPYLIWRQILYVFNGILDKFRFLRNCFFADVC